MLRTAYFYNVTWPGMIDQIKARGYGDPEIHRVSVQMEVKYGPDENPDLPSMWIEHVLLILLLGFVLFRECCRRSRW